MLDQKIDMNQKYFSIYVFLSTFSRNLIEVFIPVILYKYGYSIKEVLIYYLIINIISLVLTYPFVSISKKYTNKILSIIGIISFLVVQVFLNIMWHSLIYIFILATFYAIYRRGYWISRRYYNLKIIKKQNIVTTYSIISIINQIGVVVSSYVGSIILDFISIRELTIIAIILFLISLIPLYKLKFKHEKTEEKLKLIKTFKEMPRSNIYLFGSYELLNIVKFLIPLYIFIYVKNTYRTIGILNLITNVAIIFFTYFYGKNLNKSKNNYLKIAIVLTVLLYIFKINTAGILLLIISFAEGIILKMYELSINKEFFIFSKKFEYYNYNLVYELVQNTFRSCIVLFILLLNCNLKYMIYVTLLFILIGVFMNFKNDKIIN